MINSISRGQSQARNNYLQPANGNSYQGSRPAPNNSAGSAQGADNSNAQGTNSFIEKTTKQVGRLDNVTGIYKNYSDAKGHYSETFSHLGSAGKKIASGDLKGGGKELLDAGKSDVSATLDMFQGGLKGSQILVPSLSPGLALIDNLIGKFRSATGL